MGTKRKKQTKKTVETEKQNGDSALILAVILRDKKVFGTLFQVT